MPFYATQEDVLRVLGGTLRTVQSHFARSLWDGSFPVTLVTVDDNDFEVPNTVLVRIGVQLGMADSRIDGYVLQAYKSRPPTVPLHLKSATARLAAYHVLTTDGVKTEFIKDLHKETHGYMKDLAAAKFDLGIVTPRPRYRFPGAIITTRSP